MDRRKSIKALLLGSVATGTLIEACNTADKKTAPATEQAVTDSKKEEPTRMAEETTYGKQLDSSPKFFTPHEMATITLLGDIIIPRDEVSGSASDAKVPEFIEFIVKDIPKHQIPVRGGLRWLNVQCLNRYGKSFADCTSAQQIEMVDEIAYPLKAKPEMQQGVAFFNLMRNLVTTGFYTSQIGVKDLEYMGNVPNNWNGVPDDVLKKHGLAYSEKELRECVSFS